MSEVLLGQPEFQVALQFRIHIQESDSSVSHFIDPGYFSVNLHLNFALWEVKADSHRTGKRDWASKAKAYASLAEVHKIGFDLFPGSVCDGYRQIKGMPVVAETAVENHVAGGGKGAHRLLN